MKVASGSCVARYYDPRTSVWQSVDPILGAYLPTGNKQQDKNLAGMGGVYNSFNLSFYTYAGSNPLVFKDPDGNVTKGVVKITSALIKASQAEVRIINKSLAGGVHPVTKVPFNSKGFPDFSKWVKKEVKITQSKNRDADFRAANEKAGYIKTPKNMTWHHHEDGKTMQLVSTIVHDKTAHTGGIAVIKKAAAIAGSLSSSIANASGEDWAKFGVDMITPLILETGGLAQDADKVSKRSRWGSGTPFKDMGEYSNYLKKRNEAEGW